MILTIDRKVAKDFAATLPTTNDSEIELEDWSLELSAFKLRKMFDRSNYGDFSVPLSGMGLEFADSLLRYLEEFSPEDYKKNSTKILTYIKVLKELDSRPIRTLDTLVAALTSYIHKAPHRWIFKFNSELGHYTPCAVTEITYVPAERDVEASVLVRTARFERGRIQKGVLSWSASQVSTKKLTVSQLLQGAGYFLENESLFADYERDLDAWREVHPSTGTQYLSDSKIYNNRHGIRTLLHNGKPSKVVVHDLDNPESIYGGENPVVTDKFWNPTSWKQITVPESCVVTVFSLLDNKYYDVHVSTLEKYIYNDSATDNLVIGDGIKEIIEALCFSANNLFRDIVEGKSEGIFILSTGSPGLGKTLSAQLYSEKLHRPLYTVQTSELGLRPDEVEKNLQVVLSRANLLGAVLLLDEADVYFRVRGDDLLQNAIVGVFLRLLEQSRTIIMATSNREDIIDPAIFSRCSALIRYELPTPKDLVRIWDILCRSNGLNPPANLLVELGHRYGRISGRDALSSLKLAIALAKKRDLKIPDLECFDLAASFQGIHVADDQDR